MDKVKCYLLQVNRLLDDALDNTVKQWQFDGFDLVELTLASQVEFDDGVTTDSEDEDEYEDDEEEQPVEEGL